MSWNRMGVALLGAVVAVMTIGCAEERAPINRVQANALAKSFFVGEDLLSPNDDPEFYNQATLIDAPYGVSQGWLYPSTWTQMPTRVKWQITEDLLLGRMTYELIEDTGGRGAGAADNDGQIVVAFRIASHFDIRRGYNPSTGEELNVIEENVSDRPWYEREYFRVDWSQNLQTDGYDFDPLALMGVVGGVHYSPLAYYVNDPTDPDAPYFDVETGYFDVTNKAFATPQNIDLSHMGWSITEIPACWLPDEFFAGTWPKGNCNPSEITIRHAFRRVVDTDYEPADWDGYRFQSYGAFLKERYGYARNYGMSDAKWHRFITRYNVWERSHYYEDPEAMTGWIPCFTPETTPLGGDPAADDDANGTDDECEEVTDLIGTAGSRCDAFKQRCTLPFRERTVRPLAWYFTNRSNQDYFDGTRWATHEWDVAIRHAIMTARYGECRSTGGGKDECQDDWPVYHGQMDDHLDAVQLSRDVDDCRAGMIEGEDDCDALAERLGEQRGVSEGVVELAQTPELIVLCHSPVQVDDDPRCAPPEERLPANVSARDCAQAEQDRDESLLPTCRAARYARRGDLRYHLINVFWEPHSPSSWGIYTDAEDPLTGETFSAAINVWSHVTDLFSQMIVDRARLIGGELTEGDITEAEHVHNYARATEMAAYGGGVAGRLDRQTFDRKIAEYGGMSAEELHANLAQLKQEHPEVLAEAGKLKSQLRQVMASVDAPSAMAPKYEARRQQAIGSSVEAELVDPMMQKMAGVDDLQLTSEAMNFASPLRMANPSWMREFRNLKQAAMARYGSCILDMAEAPLSLTGMADILEEKFEDDHGPFDASDSLEDQAERAEAMRQYVAQRVHYAVIVHEMGHSIGQRHNFVSSSDAFSYRPQYWQLRTQDGEVTKRCGCADDSMPDEWCFSYEADGASCVGPRYFDPMTKAERDNMIWMFMHSSVMDYAGEYSQDLLGLAAWDVASARIFYGDMVSVYDEDRYDLNYEPYVDEGELTTGLFAKMDNFGGIIGIPVSIGQRKQGSSGSEWRDIHYSELNNFHQLVSDCREVDPEDYKPLTWNEERDGKFHPVLDGLIVSPKGDGVYTKCKQAKVDYVPWSTLRMPVEGEDYPEGLYYRAGPSVDRENRVRVPYGFATDGWADLGNASVYRHDNGADVYEITNFLMTQQEVQHIFSMYRRGQMDFSVRKKALRNLSRYNEKIRDAAKGVGLYANIYREFWLNSGYDFDWLWPQLAYYWFPDNILAAGMTFDHFARTLARPEAGGHFADPNAGIMRSAYDAWFSEPDEEDPATWAFIVPNGATAFHSEGTPGNAAGYFGNVGMGGKMTENMLCDWCGEYDRDYTMNCGAYYDKVYSAYLMTESVDNFISDSRLDFVDGRYRAVSIADLFPDGYRRWLATNLTGDEAMKGPHIAALASDVENAVIGSQCGEFDNFADCEDCCQYRGADITVAQWTGTCQCYGGPSLYEGSTQFHGQTIDHAFPAEGLGWVTWWTTIPEVCWPNGDTQVCSQYGHSGSADQGLDWDAVPDFEPRAPAHSMVLEGQVGWDQQKFLINWTMLYLPENEQQWWLNMLRMWEMGIDSDPGFANRIELHDPYGKVFVAKTFGKEEIFGRQVQRGIAARMLEYANSLMVEAFEVTDGPDLDGDGNPDWYLPAFDPNTGKPIVKPDPSLDGNCFGTSCTCSANRACVLLQRYMALPYYMRQTMAAYGLIDPELEGVWE